MPGMVAESERAFATAVRAVVFRLRRLGEHSLGIEPLRLSEVDVLVHVMDHPRVGVTEVAQALALRPSNVSVTVRVLVERGLLVREGDPRDARRSLLVATDRAVADRARIDEAWTTVIGAFLRDLPDAERAAALAATAALRRLADLDLTTRPAGATTGPVVRSAGGTAASRSRTGPGPDRPRTARPRPA